MFQRKTSPALTVNDLYVQKKKKFSEQNTLPVIKEATRLFLFLTVSYADEAVKLTAFETLYREKHGGASSLSALLPYVFAALANTVSCVLQSVFLLRSVFET